MRDFDARDFDERYSDERRTVKTSKRRSGGASRRGFDGDDPIFLKRARRDGDGAGDEWDAELGDAARWSTWDQSAAGQRGPQPYPEWLVTELAAKDTELGILKTGKEADVFLIERGVPGADRACLLAAKRYRDPKHRLFHRDAGYLEGRRVRESRDNRAMAKRTAIGRDMISVQWANAEFNALRDMYEWGVPVPYPVQVLGTELLLEFIGDHDTRHAAPRLAQIRADEEDLVDLWDQLTRAASLLARAGFAHGDLSAYNILVHEGRLILIDVPQIVDVIANPRGREFLIRDARNVAAWFASRGLDVSGDDLAAELIADASLR